MGDNCKEMECAVIELNDLTAIFKLFFLAVENYFLAAVKAEQFPVNGPIESKQCVSRWQSRQRVPLLFFFFFLTIGFDANKAID